MVRARLQEAVKRLQNSGQSEAIAIGDVLESWLEDTDKRMLSGALGTLDEFISIARAAKKYLKAIR